MRQRCVGAAASRHVVWRARWLAAHERGEGPRAARTAPTALSGQGSGMAGGACAVLQASPTGAVATGVTAGRRTPRRARPPRGCTGTRRCRLQRSTGTSLRTRQRPRSRQRDDAARSLNSQVFTSSCERLAVPLGMSPRPPRGRSTMTSPPQGRRNCSQSVFGFTAPLLAPSSSARAVQGPSARVHRPAAPLKARTKQCG